MTHREGFGINLIGYASANLGQGVALRNTAATLDRAGIPFCIVDVDPGGRRTGHDYSCQSRFHQATLPLPYPVNIYQMNPPEIALLLSMARAYWDFERKMNVCVPFWELPHLPQYWVQILEQMDLLLAPSHFIQHMLNVHLNGTPCRYYRQSLAMPAESIPDRRRWGLRDDEVAFLFSFDMSSGIWRKNPAAVVHAFAQAFPNGDGVALLLKLNNTTYNETTVHVTQQFLAHTAGVPNLRIVDQALSYPEVLSLYASVDVYVSLHRGEGLGLSLLECMALGKPVIATAWSGNMDFMDDANSCLVRYTFVPVPEDSPYYFPRDGGGPQWAEPSVDDASRWMVRLADDAKLRLAIGAKARQDAQSFIAEANRGTVFAGVRAIYDYQSAAPKHVDLSI